MQKASLWHIAAHLADLLGAEADSVPDGVQLTAHDVIKITQQPVIQSELRAMQVVGE